MTLPADLFRRLGQLLLLGDMCNLYRLTKIAAGAWPTAVWMPGAEPGLPTRRLGLSSVTGKMRIGGMAVLAEVIASAFANGMPLAARLPAANRSAHREPYPEDLSEFLADHRDAAGKAQ